MSEREILFYLNVCRTRHTYTTILNLRDIWQEANSCDITSSPVGRPNGLKMAKQKGKKKRKKKIRFSLPPLFFVPKNPRKRGAVGLRLLLGRAQTHARAKQRPVLFCFVSPRNKARSKGKNNAAEKEARQGRRQRTIGSHRHRGSRTMSAEKVQTGVQEAVSGGENREALH